MKNSSIELKSQDEKTAKAVAGTIGRFLTDKGITLPRTQVLDLVGVLTGHADWRSLNAHLEAEAVKRRGTPQQISREDFIKRFKPMKNPFDKHAEFDGFAFGIRGEAFAYVESILASDPSRVWTVTDGDTSQWLSSGYHYVNRQFHVIAHVPLKDGEDFEVPYGHDLGDKLYKVSVYDDPGAEIYSDEVYATDARDAREQLQGDIEAETEEMREAGEAFYVYVEEVKS